MNRDLLIEMALTVGAILVGLIIAKQVTNLMERSGLPIAGGDPLPVPLPMSVGAS